MEELGREYRQLDNHYACDCCGSWIPKGSFNVLIAYAKEPEHYPQYGRRFVFQWHCLSCEEVGA